MAIITRAQVKTYLGIDSTLYDDQIDVYIPIVEAKVKQICKNDFNMLILGTTTEDSTSMTVSSIYWDYYYPYEYSSNNVNQPMKPENIGDFIEYGMQVTGDDIASGTYITAVLNDPDYITPTVTLSTAATGTGSGSRIYLGFNIAYHPTVAKGIYWMITGESTSMPGNSVTSRSMGSVSVSYSDSDNKLDGKSGMPMWFVKALPKYMGAY